MPLTKQIIANVVRDVVKSELVEVNNCLSKVEHHLSHIEKKVDNLTDTVSDFAGQVKKFDEEQTVMSEQISDRTDRIEKLEISVFGSAVV